MKKKYEEDRNLQKTYNVIKQHEIFIKEEAFQSTTNEKKEENIYIL